MNKWNNERIKIKVPCGEIFLHVNFDENNKIFQTHVYINKDFKNAECIKVMFETISRLVSLCLKNGIPLRKITDELVNQNCLLSVPRRFKSCPDAIGNILKMIANNQEKELEEILGGEE